MWVDSHCHLEFDHLAADLDGVIARARNVGVGRMLTIGTKKSDLAKVLAIAERYADIFCSVGVHPHEAEKAGEDISCAELVALAQHPKVVGIGEAGLDYFYDFAPRKAQQRVFREHVRAALETDLPLIIHTRDAETDTMRILVEETQNMSKKLRGVLHCYSSNAELARFGLDLGLYVSFSGMITFKKSENVREIARFVPLNRLLLETDSPYLAPIPHRGKTCEPAFVVDTGRYLADFKGVSVAEMEAATTANFFNLFNKVTPP